MRWMAPVLMLLMLVVAAPEPAVAGNYSNVSKRAKSEINAIREKNGRKTVKPSFLLYKAARIHARDMVKNGLFSHTGSDGSDVGARAKRVGYSYCYINENIAKGQGTISEVIDAWMASEGHKENLLARKARHFGLVKGPSNTWVLVMGRKTSKC